MIRAGGFRRQQQEHEIDRHAVDRLEIDRLLQRATRPNSFSTVASLPCGMAMPSPIPVEPRRSRCNSVSKISCASKAREAGRVGADFLECLLLPVGFHRGKDGFGRQDIKKHDGHQARSRKGASAGLRANTLIAMCRPRIVCGETNTGLMIMAGTVDRSSRSLRPCGGRRY